MRIDKDSERIISERRIRMEIGQTANQIASISRKAARYLPEPASRGVGMFLDVMDAVKSVGKAAIGGVDTFAGGDFASLINLQIETQKEMQTTSMVSNIEKSKHESKMAAIRNVRVN